VALAAAASAPRKQPSAIAHRRRSSHHRLSTIRVAATRRLRMRPTTTPLRRRLWYVGGRETRSSWTMNWCGLSGDDGYPGVRHSVLLFVLVGMMYSTVGGHAF
jgi:hypothetical protein